MAFHIELKDGRDVLRAFNLSEADVLSRFVGPLRAGVRFSIEDKEFEPRKARLIVMEGPHMAPGELGLGLGWTNAVKRGADVTERFLARGAVGLAGAAGAAGAAGGTRTAPGPAGPGLEPLARLRERLLGRLAAGPLDLGEALALSADLLAGHRVSERLAATETVVWELLHTDADRALSRGGERLGRADWEGVVLAAATWLPTPGDLRVELS